MRDPKNEFSDDWRVRARDLLGMPVLPLPRDGGDWQQIGDVLHIVLKVWIEK